MASVIRGKTQEDNNNKAKKTNFNQPSNIEENELTSQPFYCVFEVFIWPTLDQKRTNKQQGTNKWTKKQIKTNKAAANLEGNKLTLQPWYCVLGVFTYDLLLRKVRVLPNKFHFQCPATFTQIQYGIVIQFELVLNPDNHITHTQCDKVHAPGLCFTLAKTRKFWWNEYTCSQLYRFHWKCE